MNMQAVLIRTAILLVMCLGLSIAVIRRDPAQVSLLQAPTIAAARTPTSATPLPAIAVRPSAAEITAAMNGETTEFNATPRFIDTTEQQPILDTSATLRSLRLDMPYYSFGKALPHVSKE